MFQRHGLPEDWRQRHLSGQPRRLRCGRTLCISLTPQAKHTLAVLDQTGIFEEGYSLAAYERRGGGGIDTTALPMPEQAG